jgi:hypothetical protein
MKKRHSAEQIVGMLRQADVALGKGQKVPESNPIGNCRILRQDIKLLRRQDADRSP